MSSTALFGTIHESHLGVFTKSHKLHRIAPFYILIYLIIFNIKYIINSLITLVFSKKI